VVELESFDRALRGGDVGPNPQFTNSPVSGNLVEPEARAPAPVDPRLRRRAHRRGRWWPGIGGRAVSDGADVACTRGRARALADGGPVLACRPDVGAGRGGCDHGPELGAGVSLAPVAAPDSDRLVAISVTDGRTGQQTPIFGRGLRSGTEFRGAFAAGCERLGRAMRGPMALWSGCRRPSSTSTGASRFAASTLRAIAHSNRRSSAFCSSTTMRGRIGGIGSAVARQRPCSKERSRHDLVGETVNTFAKLDTLGEPTVVEIIPNEAAFAALVPGFPKFGVLNTLKASTRNSIRWDTPIAADLLRATSTLA
jgi:hypothetical protein